MGLIKTVFLVITLVLANLKSVLSKLLQESYAIPDMEDHTLGFWRFVFQRILIPAIVFFGLIGNLVSVVVLTQRRMRCSTNIYLTALAVMDMMYLLFIFILSLAHYPNINSIRFEVFWRTFGLSHWLCDAANSSSIYLTISFTIERYIAVCHPIRGQVLCTESRAKRVIAAVILMCFLLTMSTAFEYRLITTSKFVHPVTGEPCNNTVTPMLASTTTEDLSAFAAFMCNSTDIGDYTNCFSDKLIESMYNITSSTAAATIDEVVCEELIFVRATDSDLSTNLYYRAVFYPFTTVAFIFLPLILLATFNIFLVNAVRRSHQMRQSITRMSSVRQNDAMTTQENKITTILISVVLLFLFCQTPAAIMLIYSLIPGMDHGSNMVLALGNLCNFLMTLNSASNFILYCALSDKYRQTMKALCFFKKYRAKRQNTINSSRFSRNATKEIELTSVCPKYNNTLATGNALSNRARHERLPSISSAVIKIPRSSITPTAEYTDFEMNSRKSSRASDHHPNNLKIMNSGSNGNGNGNGSSQNSLQRSHSMTLRPAIRHSFDCQSANTKF